MPYKTWQCGTCGFLYDEAEGLPEEVSRPAPVATFPMTGFAQTAA